MLNSHGVNITLLKNIIENFPKIYFIIVSNKLKINANNVSIQSNVSDEKLRELYSFADIMFRPLDFATANNSILESIAMRIPIITNKISGIENYLSPNNSFLALNNEEFILIFKLY